jgi:hypothetical protein
MRSVVSVAIAFVALAFVEICLPERAWTAPLLVRTQFVGQHIAAQKVGDACDWWGTRWQFGWRGYGWYTCWELPKPFPTVIDPEVTPPEAAAPPLVVTKPCVKKWRDSDGNWHARRTC